MISIDNTKQIADALRSMDELVYLGFNSRVVALDRLTGEIVWDWKSPEGRSAHVPVLIDGDRLIVSAQGYTYCLDPVTGEQLWDNPLKGYGFGIPSITSINGSTGMSAAAVADVLAQQQMTSQTTTTAVIVST